MCISQRERSEAVFSVYCDKCFCYLIVWDRSQVLDLWEDAQKVVADYSMLEGHLCL